MIKVGIVGLGLIGGSIALDLRSLGYQVFGVSRRQQTCQLALEKKIVDQASLDLSLMADVELVILCTPIAAIIPTIEKLSLYLAPETIITDVGSVKQSIVESVGTLWSNFVGGHPMAGTADAGIQAAQKHLFVDAPYVITPTETTPIAAIKIVESLAQSLGSHVYFCRPEEHDRAVALISHLPLMVSANLIATCLGELDREILDLAQKLASSGFRDTSRVGGGNPELGIMIAQNNQEQLKQSLYQYRHNLDYLIELIETENWQMLAEFLQATQEARPDFLV